MKIGEIRETARRLHELTANLPKLMDQRDRLVAEIDRRTREVLALNGNPLIQPPAEAWLGEKARPYVDGQAVQRQLQHGHHLPALGVEPLMAS